MQSVLAITIEMQVIQQGIELYVVYMGIVPLQLSGPSPAVAAETRQPLSRLDAQLVLFAPHLFNGP